MGSRLTITPPNGNTAGQYDLRGLITGKPRAGALDSLYGPGYLDKVAASKEATGGKYGFKQEMFGPVADELQAGVSAAIDYIYGGASGNPQEFGRLYDERLGGARQEQDAYREENPVTSIGANVLGGLSLAPAKALQAGVAIPGILGRVGMGAKAGAVGGGAAGFAEGRDGVVQRGRTAALGGAAGAALGGALPLATGAITKLSRGIMNGLGITGRGADAAARKLFLEALEKDGLGLKDIAAITSTRPLTLADLGENSRALLGSAYRGSKEGRKIITDFLGERQAAQFGRVTGELSEGIGQKPEAFAQTADDLVTARRANAKTSYNQAYQQGKVVIDDELRDLLRRADKLGAVSQGRKLGEAAGIKFETPKGARQDIPFDDISPGGGKAAYEPGVTSDMADAVAHRQEVDGFFKRYDEVSREISGLQKRPVTRSIVERGGIDPMSPLADDLRAMGITSKSTPGLYRRGGLKDVDNIPSSEATAGIREQGGYGNTYADRQSIIDAIAAEQRGAVRGGADDALAREMADMDRMLPEYERLRADLPPRESSPFPGDIETDTEIGVDALDYLTRGLSDTGPRGSNENRIATALARQIDERVPALRAARQQYASDSSMMDALDAGRAFMRGDTEGVGRALGAMSGAEQDLYRLGAARELRGKFAKVRDQNDIARFFENPDMRDRLKEVFPDRGSFEKFMAAVDEESAMNLTRNKVTAGSQTAERLADDSGLAGDLVATGADLAGGGGAASLMRAGGRIAGQLNDRFSQRMTEQTGAALARLGTRTDLGDVATRMALPGPRVENLPSVAARVPGLGQVKPSPAGIAAGAAVGRGLTPDTPKAPQGSRLQITPPSESRINLEMPQGFAPLKSSLGESDQSIAQAGATAPIPKEVGRIAIGPVTSTNLAKAFVGKGEANAARPISAFITRMTGSNIDIRETPWCAAFVNAVLKGSGSEGTGKLNARSFLKFGTAADKPQTGDIAVFSRGDPKGWQGHVGFYAGEVEKDGQTYVRVIGGNQGDEVSEKLYPKARLLGYRRPPSVKA